MALPTSRAASCPPRPVRPRCPGAPRAQASAPARAGAGETDPAASTAASCAVRVWRCRVPPPPATARAPPRAVATRSRPGYPPHTRTCAPALCPLTAGSHPACRLRSRELDATRARVGGNAHATATCPRPRRAADRSSPKRPAPMPRAAMTLLGWKPRAERPLPADRGSRSRRLPPETIMPVPRWQMPQPLKTRRRARFAPARKPDPTRAGSDHRRAGRGDHTDHAPASQNPR